MSLRLLQTLAAVSLKCIYECDDSAEWSGIRRAFVRTLAGNARRVAAAVAVVERSGRAHARGCGQGGVVVPGAGADPDFRLLLPAGAGVAGAQCHGFRYLRYRQSIRHA